MQNLSTILLQCFHLFTDCLRWPPLNYIRDGGYGSNNPIQKWWVESGKSSIRVWFVRYFNLHAPPPPHTPSSMLAPRKSLPNSIQHWMGSWGFCLVYVCLGFYQFLLYSVILIFKFRGLHMQATQGSAGQATKGWNITRDGRHLPGRQSPRDGEVFTWPPKSQGWGGIYLTAKVPGMGEVFTWPPKSQGWGRYLPDRQSPRDGDVFTWPPKSQGWGGIYLTAKVPGMGEVFTWPPKSQGWGRYLPDRQSPRY